MKFEFECCFGCVCDAGILENKRIWVRINIVCKAVTIFHSACSTQNIHKLCSFDDHLNVLILLRQSREWKTLNTEYSAILFSSFVAAIVFIAYYYWLN
jgi:hypothetical protein